MIDPTWGSSLDSPNPEHGIKVVVLTYLGEDIVAIVVHVSDKSARPRTYSFLLFGKECIGLGRLFLLHGWLRFVQVQISILVGYQR